VFNAVFSGNETIQHLFFDYHMARLMWNIVCMSFGIQPPSSVVANLFGSWLKSSPFMLKNQVLIGTSALCWALWLC
jgi:hypothetical protein